MNNNYKITDLLSLLKVFDCNYATDDDLEKIQELNVNDKQDVEQIISLLLEPQFKYSSQEEKDMLVETLEYFCSQDNANWNGLFGELLLIFDDEVKNKRDFLLSILMKLKNLANQSTINFGG